MTDDNLDLYRGMFERHPAAQLLVDAASGRIVQANPAAQAFYGCGEGRLRQMQLAELLVNPPGEIEDIIASLFSGTKSRVATRQSGRRGARRHVEIEATLLETPTHGRLLYATMHDLTDQVRFENALRDYREIFEHVPVPFYRTTRGATGRFVRFNPAFMRLLECDSPEMLFECDVSSIYADPHDRERFSNALMRDGQVNRYEIQLRTFTGRLIWAADTAYQHIDDDGNHVFDGVIEDVTRQRELEQELSYQARHDELTKLANRRHCENVLQSEIERCDRYGQPLSMVMLDLDHFKQVNDELGHAEGDNVLQRAAWIVQSHVRQTDVAGRWGGEEFVVLLPSTRNWGAQQLAEKLRSAIAEQPQDQGHGVTTSVGFAEYVRGEGKDRFLGRLDESLYAAKRAGRNRVVKAEAPPRAAS